MKPYDIIVIGSGPGGYVAAIKAAHGGARVALIEKEHIGGLCLNWGCIPSKILLKQSNAVWAMRQMLEQDLASGTVEIDFENMITHSREKIEGIRKSLTGLIEGNGVEIIMGEARLTSSTTVEMSDGNTLEASSGILLATGASARGLPVFEIDGVHIVTVREALAFSSQPESLAIIGGGVVGCEMATFFAQLGTKVTILEYQDQILPGTDNAVVRALMRNFRKMGIEVRTNADVSETLVNKLDNVVSLTVKDGEDVVAEKVLLAVGIQPNTDSLGIDELGVEMNNGYVVVDKTTYETSLAGVYAIGDVIQLRGSTIPHPALAHVASAEAERAVEHILNANVTNALDYENIPMTIFTTPQIATVGLTKEETEKRYPDDDIVELKIGDGTMGVGMALDEKTGFTSIVVNKSRYNAIEGAQIIGPAATERIHTFVEARGAQDSATLMARQIFAHPTFSEVSREALLTLSESAPHVLPVVKEKKE